ncbi:hypothetical protein BGAL_0019g00250 [Botrytis galanthina]|uniref:Uncharacterized protein n=1 Tax=Botrytis galanthina TaxID=278940 RepID=A0A4S8RM71_9HELO|nr:hypothetical protein BGAL_0019g00250 [Botrytis galanthina]
MATGMFISKKLNLFKLPRLVLRCGSNMQTASQRYAKFVDVVMHSIFLLHQTRDAQLMSSFQLWSEPIVNEEIKGNNQLDF